MLQASSTLSSWPTVVNRRPAPEMTAAHAHMLVTQTIGVRHHSGRVQHAGQTRCNPTCVLGVCAAGQYNDAAYSLVQLRKILEDSTSQPGGKDVLPGSKLASLQAACASCEASLEEVRRTASRG
jgi:hypothetical protein